MKNIAFIFTLLTSLCFRFSNAQNNIVPPSPGKAVVYFVRPSNMGMAINFSYMDSAQLIGRFAGPAYIRYECEPGHHLFWARSENRDYVEADLAPDQIYFIQSMVAMGAVKAQVDLVPTNPKTDTKDMERMLKLIGKRPSEAFSADKLDSDRAQLAPAIERGLKTYSEEEDRSVRHDMLPADWAYVRR